MTIFVANKNGDWWEYEPGETIYVLDTKDLDEMQKQEIATLGYMEGSLITDHGTKIKLNLGEVKPMSAFYSDDELDAEANEFDKYEFNEAYDEAIEEVAAELDVEPELLSDNNAVNEIITSYVNDNITYAQMVNKVYSRISHPSAQGDTK